MLIDDVTQRSVPTQGADENGRTRSDKAVITKREAFSSVPPIRPQTTPTRRPIATTHEDESNAENEDIATLSISRTVEPRYFVMAERGWARSRAKNWDSIKR